MMADLQVADLSLVTCFASAPARNLSRSASVREAPKAPTCKNPRRDVPSQNHSFAPQTVNMTPPQLCGRMRRPFAHPIRARRGVQPGIVVASTIFSVLGG